MLMAALVVLIIFALSARRERVKDQADLQSMARAVTVMLPHASSSTRLQLLSVIAAEAAKQGERQGTAPGRIIAAASTRVLPPAEQASREQSPAEGKQVPAEEGNGGQPGQFRGGEQRRIGDRGKLKRRTKAEVRALVVEYQAGRYTPISRQERFWLDQQVRMQGE